jgi:predicted esterase
MAGNTQFRSIQIAHSVDYAVCPPSADVETPQLLLALHGWGQSCERFSRWVAPLAERGFVVAVPQAPHQLYINYEPKTVGFNWLTIHEKERSIAEFVDYMHQLIKTLHAEFPFDEDRVCLLGFSQGVSMSYRFAVRGGLEVGAVVACGSDLPPDVAEELPNRDAFPVLIVHGKEDPMAKIDKAEAALAELRRHGFSPDTNFFDGGHQLPREVVGEIGDWLVANAFKTEGAQA